MSASSGLLQLAPDHHAALTHAVQLLERTSFAMKIADLAGQPVTRVLGMLPRTANRQLVKLLETAILRCLAVAIESLDDGPAEIPSRWVPQVISGVAGGVAGLFGAAALPIVGAVGGATVNVMFMSHFQQIAEGHFTIRRLERHYGDAPVRGLYRAIARDRGAS